MKQRMQPHSYFTGALFAVLQLQMCQFSRQTHLHRFIIVFRTQHNTKSFTCVFKGVNKINEEEEVEIILLHNAKHRQHRKHSEYSDFTNSSVSDKINNPDYLCSLQILWHIFLWLRGVHDSDMPQFWSKRLYPAHPIFLDSYILAESSSLLLSNRHCSK